MHLEHPLCMVPNRYGLDVVSSPILCGSMLGGVFEPNRGMTILEIFSQTATFW